MNAELIDYRPQVHSIEIDDAFAQDEAAAQLHARLSIALDVPGFSDEAAKHFVASENPRARAHVAATPEAAAGRATQKVLSALIDAPQDPVGREVTQKVLSTVRNFFSEGSHRKIAPGTLNTRMTLAHALLTQGLEFYKSQKQLWLIPLLAKTAIALEGNATDHADAFALLDLTADTHAHADIQWAMDAQSKDVFVYLESPLLPA